MCNPRERITASQALDHLYFWTDPLPADPKTYAPSLSMVLLLLSDWVSDYRLTKHLTSSTRVTAGLRSPRRRHLISTLAGRHHSLDHGRRYSTIAGFNPLGKCSGIGRLSRRGTQHREWVNNKVFPRLGTAGRRMRDGPTASRMRGMARMATARDRIPEATTTALVTATRSITGTCQGT